jgi:hypothetical protein
MQKPESDVLIPTTCVKFLAGDCEYGPLHPCRRAPHPITLGECQ